MNAPFTQLPEAGAGRIPRKGLVPSLERRRLRIYLLMVIGDVAALLAAFWIGAQVYFDIVLQTEELNRPILFEVYLLLPIYLTIAFYNATYSLKSLADWRHAAFSMIGALAISAALLNFFAFYAKANEEFSRGAFTLGIIGAAAAMLVFRVWIVRIARQTCGPTLRNVLVIADGGPEVRINHALHISAQELAISPKLDDPLGLDRLGRVLQNMDRVVVSCTQERRADWSLALKAAGVDGDIVDEMVRDIGAIGVRHYDDADVSALVLASGPLGMRARITKRAFDIVIAGVSLLALSPVLLVCAIAILIEGGRPVFFVQQRLGRGNRLFHILKFRTMHTNSTDRTGARSAGREDERITSVGRLLRRTSIDELPQLWNVLKGEMSLVGPRPHALGSQAGTKLFWEVDRRYWQRHALKPGLTGLAQVRGLRGATDHEGDLSSRLQADLEYVDGWSIWRDIAILFGTLRVLVHDRAY